MQAGGELVDDDLELSDGLEARSSKAAPPGRRPASDCLALLSDVLTSH
jgi:hypothetical protein